MHKDLNDAINAGASLADLVDAAQPMAELSPDEDTVERCQAKVRAWIEARKGDGRDALISAVGEAIGNASLVRAFAVCHEHGLRDGPVAFASIASTRGLSRLVSELERAVRAQAKAMRAKPPPPPKPQTQASVGRVLEGLDQDGDGLTIPAGYVLTDVGVFAPDGAQLSLAPILIVGRSADSDTGKQQVLLAWCQGGRWSKHSAPRGVIVSPRKLLDLGDDGAPVLAAGAEGLSQFLCEMEAANNFETAQSRARMGWVDDDSFLWGYQRIGSGASVLAPEDTDRTIARRFRSSGTREGWQETFDLYCHPSPFMYCGLYASAAAVLLRPLERPGFVLDVSGDTSHGKTKVLVAGASLWGDPTIPGGVISGWNTTLAAIESGAAFLGSLPILIDDTKNRHSDSAVARAAYSLPFGEETKRAARSGRGQRVREWLSVTMSTGEAPLPSFTKDAGARARVLCLKGEPLGPSTEENKERADLLNAGFLANHGHIGPILVEWLISNKARWPELRKLHAELERSYFGEKMPDGSYASKYRASEKVRRSGIAMRLVGHVAVMHVAALVLHNELGVHGIDDLHSTIDFLLDLICSEIDEADMPKAAAHALYDWACANNSRFYGRHPDFMWGNKRPPASVPEWVGVWELDPNWTEIAFRIQAVNDLLALWKYDVEAVRRSWKARGWLILDKHGNLPARGPGLSRMVVLKREFLEHVKATEPESL